MSRIHFRSKKFADLVETAVRQGFSEHVRGSGHLALKCPRCGEITIVSGSQRDNGNRRYLNVETRLRHHGLTVKGKPAKGRCRMDFVIGNVYIPVYPRYKDSPKTLGVFVNESDAKAALVEEYSAIKGVEIEEGWWVPSETHGGEKYGTDSGQLGFYDSAYSDTGWFIECRSLDYGIR